MTRCFLRGVLSVFLLYTFVQITACGSGGPDAPFVFGGDTGGGQPSGSPSGGPGGGGGCEPACPAGQVCQNGSCVAAPSPCDSDGDCTSPQICNTSTGQCVNPPEPACDADDDCSGGLHCKNPPGQCVSCLNDGHCPSGQVCDQTTNQCRLPSTGACEVDFDASLVLKIDDAHQTMIQHFDSPSACCQYAEADNDSTCPSLNPAHLDNFMQPPSEAFDLYCCATNPAVDTDVDVAALGVTLPPYVHSLYCDAENRHNDPPQPELAATRWKAMQPGGQGGGKIKLRFSVTGTGPGNCQVEIDPINFPEYRLDNTALDAALIIDAGKDYQTFPGGTGQPLNPATLGTCEVTEDAGGNIEVKITSLPLRFMARVYQSHSQCVAHIRSQPAICPEAFSTLYSADPAASVQILPGFSVPQFSLTTEHHEVAVLDDALQDPMGLTGSPLRFQEGVGSRMSLVVAFSMPDNGFVGFRDDQTGTGQLNAQLSKALLTAELAGPVTKAGTSQPIQTLADLTNCGGGGGGTPTAEKLYLTLQADYEPDNPANPQQTIDVSGNPEDPSQGFTATAFFPSTNLPFAREQSDIDSPNPALAGRFTRQARITATIGANSTVDVPLSIPTAPFGAFRVLNAADFQNMTLAGGHENQVSLDVQFEPTTNAANGCTTDPATGIVTCQADLSFSSSPSIAVHLSGQAKSPAAELQMAMGEINQVPSDGTMQGVSLTSPLPTIDFGEARLRYETKTRLFRISNTGVRDLNISNLQAVDAQRNFRLGSVYRGPDFQNRQWIVGHPELWNLPPTGASNLFFFLNYGPFGAVPGAAAGATRNDSGFLNLVTSAGGFNLPLSGIAKEDHRARMALYIQDETRFAVESAANPGHQPDLALPSGEHLYLAEDQFFSFRQDASPNRAIYLKNLAAGGEEELLIQDFQEEDPAGKFDFTIDPAFQAVLTACAGNPSACPVLGTSAPANLVKIGTVTFNAVTSGSYSISVGKFKFRAVSRQSNVNPVVVGNADDNTVVQCSGGMICYDIKGANGAPHKVGGSAYDLRIHRLFAGLDSPFPNSSAKAISTTTRGILERRTPPLSSELISNYTEVFTLPDVLELDAEEGTAVLHGVFTRIVPPLVNPTQWPVDVEGVRIFNGPASAPATDFLIQCATSVSPPPQCVFFYLYLGDWASPMPTCSSKPIIGQSFTANVPGTAADPMADDGVCMETQLGNIPIQGSYDPVTGEIHLRDVAVRLYSPNNPGAGGQPIDSTLHLDLTTGCVEDELMYGTIDPSLKQVPQAAINYTVPLMPANPLQNYTNDPACGTRRLKGRPMIQGDVNVVDPTMTLDAGTAGELPAAAYDFDLAGVAKLMTHFPQANEKMMYIVIKAQIDDF